MPDVTIVLEWDNPHLYSGSMEAHRALAALALRLHELDRSVEVVSVCSEDVAPHVTKLSDHYLAAFDTRIVAAAGARYYEMKNAGAAAARGEIVVLCDTDCELEPGALRQLVAAFEDGSRRVVAGAAYIDPTYFRGRAWALLSIFPPRTRDDGIAQVRSFLANIVAFRRQDAPMFRFPSHSRVRTQCVDLSEQLTRDGVAIWQARGARARHAAPEGLRGFVQRAFWHSYDVLDIHSGRDGRIPAAAHAVASFGAIALRRVRKLAADRRAIGVPARELPLLAATIVAYGALELLIVVFAMMHPRMPRWAE